MYRSKQQREHEKNKRFFSGVFANLSVLFILLAITPNSRGAFRVNQFQIGDAGNHAILTGQNALNATLANIGREIIQPQSVSKSFADSHGQRTKSLPAAPAALLLVLTGFFCVSAVRDRKAWLAAIAGILWLSQSGLPNMVKTLSARIIPSGHISTCCSSVQDQAKNSHAPMSMESREHLGLLYYRLGMWENSHILKILPAYRSRKIALSTESKQPTQQSAFNFTWPYPDSAVKSESFAEKHIILLSAVSPVVLSRGPPSA